jgi:hypothetical protein
MVDITIVTIISLCWFGLWYVVYTKALKRLNYLSVMVMIVHFFLMWLFTALMFYWVYLRSTTFFLLLIVGSIVQFGYLVSRISKKQ